MAVNKGLKSLNESSPNFSNQALENSINDIKKVYVIGRSYKYDLLRGMLIDGFRVINIEPLFDENGEYAICMGTI